MNNCSCVHYTILFRIVKANFTIQVAFFEFCGILIFYKIDLMKKRGFFMALPRDPFLLLSYVNTQLRDFCEDLDDLCATLSIDKGALVSQLADAGFVYDPEQNRFI